jgi:hypothetical protein
MKSSLQAQRLPPALPETLARRLNSYALAAAAAGVSVLACSQGAEAKVVTKRIGTHLEGNSYYFFNPAGQNVAFHVNASFLNHGPTSFWNRVFLQAQTTGAFFVSGPQQLPAALRAGSKIGPGRHFAKGPSYGGLLFTYGNYGGGTKNHHKGNFKFDKIEFVGFKFSMSGKEHFGWLRVKITVNSVYTITDLIDYGYETIPGKAIRAGQTKGMTDQSGEEDFGPDASLTIPISDKPQPASLGMLALGAQGVPLWRRKESVYAAVSSS